MTKPDQSTRFWTARVHLPAESWAFIVLNLADLVLTHAILKHRHSWGAESNPVARYWYQTHGVPGLVFMKFMLVAIVLVICQMIHRYRPKLARRLLIVCCIIVAFVVCYGLAMLVTYEVVIGQVGGAEPTAVGRIPPWNQRPIMYLMLSYGQRAGIAPEPALRPRMGRLPVGACCAWLTAGTG